MLRPYQERIVGQIEDELHHYTRPFVMDCFQASGKSWMIAEVAKRVGKCLVLCMSKELVEQDAEKIRVVGAECSIYSASCGEKIISNITVATIGSIRKVPEYCDRFSLIIVDECFVAGTKVDEKNIEDIKVGDYVNSYNLRTKKVEKKRVQKIIKKKSPDALYCVKGQYGTIISTGNHEYYTQRGWVRADELAMGDIVYANKTQRTSALYELWKNNSSAGDNSESKKNLLSERQNVLLHKVQQGSAREIIIGEVERPEPQEQTARSESKSNSNKKGEGDKAYLDRPSGTERRERSLFGASKNTLQKIGARMDNGTPDSDRACERWERVSNKLQGGCGKPVLPDSDRVRRGITQQQVGESSRREENNSLGEFGVESIEVLERKDYARLGLSDGGDYVYCISVEDNHNFFANGVLVHNCDAVPCDKKDSMYMEFFRKVKKPIMGLTGTAFRTSYVYSRLRNGDTIQNTVIKPLNQFKFWGKVVHGIDYHELLELKMVAPIQYSIANTDQTMLRVNSTGLDYTEDSLADYGVTNRQRVCECINGALNVWKCKRVLVAVPNIEEAEAIASMCGGATVHSKMTKRERTNIIDRFRSGEIKVIVQVLVLNVGFDLPALDCVIFARPSKSLRIWSQFVMRGGRIDPEDRDKVCRCIDMGGMLKLYGRIEDVKVKGGIVYGTYGSISDKVLNRVNISEMQRRFH